MELWFNRIGNDGSVPLKAIFGKEEVGRLLGLRGAHWLTAIGADMLHSSSITTTKQCVFSDPLLGEIDCLTLRNQGVRVFFSSAAHCPILDVRAFEINWDYVAADLSVFLSEVAQTGLKGIEHILHGECVVIRADEEKKLRYWSPSRFINTSTIDDPGVAAADCAKLVIQ